MLAAMRRGTRRSRGATWGVALATLTAVAASCADPAPPPPAVPASPAGAGALAAPAVTAYVGPPRGRGAMGGVRATRMTAALAAAGLDPANLPPLESLAPGPKQRVMRTFTEALGVPCLGCHAEDGFRADTRRKRVAKRMWNEIVRVVAIRDGSPVYCDSCHDGALFHLDRRDEEALALYMCDAMARGLRRADGRPHDCTSCHGDPPDFHLVASWKAGPAPDIVSAGAAPDAIVPRWPAATPRDPSDCGPNDERCPLVAWMRLVVTPAAAKGDAPALASALAHVASYAPPELGSFRAVAASAADAARRGDLHAAEKSCGACHDAFKAEWRAHHRTRAPE